MAALGLQPGPEVGRVKQRLADLVLEGRVEPVREALLAYAREHREDLLRP